MTNRFEITLTDEQKSRLEQIAGSRDENLVLTVQEAVTSFLDRDAEYRAYVQEGLDAVARGDVRDWDDVEAELRQKFGEFDD